MSPGLAFRYFEDDWRTLWSGVDRLQPKATGNVENLWDLNLVPADNPPVAANAADENDLMEIALANGAEDFQNTGTLYEITCEQSAYEKLKKTIAVRDSIKIKIKEWLKEIDRTG